MNALASAPNDHVVMAVSARSPDSANEFKKNFGAHHTCASYEELTLDPSVDVVYVGAINTEHYRLVKMAISNGKAVLCEKPIGMNLREATELVKLAKEKKYFLWK